MEMVSRRAAMIGGISLGTAVVLGVPKKADAFFGLLLRLFAGSTRVGAAALPGRASVAGRAMARPTRLEYQPNYYGNMQIVRTALQAGRWIRTASNSPHELAYYDPDEYRRDLGYYPEAFGSAPARIQIVNNDYRNVWVPPSDMLLQLDDGRVWHSYSIPELCVPGNGYRNVDVAMTGVPSGWGFNAVYRTADGNNAWSDYVPA